jgi:hypothetical protein
MQTNTISETFVGLNRVLVTLQLTPETNEENDAIVKTSTATANDKQKGLVEQTVLKFYHSLGNNFVLINAVVNKNGTVDMTLEKPGNMNGL